MSRTNSQTYEIPPCGDRLAQRIDRLEEDVGTQRDAILVAVGRDGRNGRLSYTAAAAEKVASELVALKKGMLGALFTILCAFGASAYNGCYRVAETDVRHEERIRALEGWRGDVERRCGPFPNSWSQQRRDGDPSR